MNRLRGGGAAGKKAKGDEDQASPMPTFFYERNKQKRENQIDSNNVYYKHNSFLFLKNYKYNYPQILSSDSLAL